MVERQHSNPIPTLEIGSENGNHKRRRRHPTSQQARVYFQDLLGEDLGAESQENKIPEGWMSIGTINSSGISHEIQKSPRWIKKNIPGAMRKMIKDKARDGIPIEYQEPLTITQTVKSGKKFTYYSPALIQSLKELADQVQTVTEGWMAIGTEKTGIAREVNKSYGWVKKQIPKAIHQIKEELRAKGISEDQQDPLFAECAGRTGVTIYYSPRVIEQIRNISEAETEKRGQKAKIRQS
ncbi:MAG TPA: hypothetical protein VNA13_02500 [Xanthomonadales bacterium]|nr:hypothetical protein [Xanthomonadales bacterium]